MLQSASIPGMKDTEDRLDHESIHCSWLSHAYACIFSGTRRERRPTFQGKVVSAITSVDCR